MVLLDCMAPERGAFLQALLWARRFHAPLLGISVLEGERLLAVESPSERDRACADFCFRQGVVWESISCKNLDRLAPVFDGPTHLLMVGRSLSPAAIRRLAYRAQAKGSMLICPELLPQLSRVLVVDGPEKADQAYLLAAIDVCRSLRASMVILSLGHSHGTAHLRRQQLQAILVRAGMEADIDLVVGSEMREAVVKIARWRRCQMVIFNRPPTNRWLNWLRPEPMSKLIDLEGTFIPMILSGEGSLRSPKDCATAAPPTAPVPHEVTPQCG